MYMPSNKASKYMKQKWIDLQGERNESTNIIGDFNIPVLVTDRSNSQNFS